MDYKLVFANDIKIESHAKGVDVVINNEHTASFAELSNVVKLYRTDKDECVKRLTGGSFFFINGQLIDHRDITYQGYIMTDSDISEIMSKLGYVTGVHVKDLKGLHLVNSGRSDYTLISPYKRRGLTLGSVELYHVWSPFSSNIRFSYKITVEEGDVIFNRPLSNHKVPITSKNWYNILLRDSELCLSKIVNIFEAKFVNLSNEKCLGKDVANINEHANIRFVQEIIDDTSKTYAEDEESHLTKLKAWQYVVELIQYDTNDGKYIGQLYQIANNLLWVK